MRVTNYEATGARCAWGGKYGAWRVAVDPHYYPHGTRILLYLPKRTVVATAEDTGGAVRGPLHIDAPTRSFIRATGLTSRGTAYCRYRVLSWGNRD
jgi:3D (Asp-Asp-Asp) domain-containing protein